MAITDLLNIIFHFVYIDRHNDTPSTSCKLGIFFCFYCHSQFLPSHRNLFFWWSIIIILIDPDSLRHLEQNICTWQLTFVLPRGSNPYHLRSSNRPLRHRARSSEGHTELKSRSLQILFLFLHTKEVIKTRFMN